MARRCSWANAPSASITAAVFMGRYDISTTLEMSMPAANSLPFTWRNTQLAKWLDFDVGGEHDHAARRHAGELRRLRAAPLQECEGACLDTRQSRPRPGTHQVPTEEERGVLGVHVQPVAPRTAQRLAHVGCLHEAETRTYVEHARLLFLVQHA